MSSQLGGREAGRGREGVGEGGGGLFVYLLRGGILHVSTVIS